MVKENINLDVQLIKTRKEFIERLEELHAVECNARDRYNEDTVTFTNFVIKDTIEEIRKDELDHIKMIDELLKMLKK